MGSHGRGAWLRRFSPLRSVQGKMVAVFLLLTYLAMQIISVGLLNRLQSYSIDAYQATLRQELASMLDGISTPSGDSAAMWKQIQATVQERMQLFPLVNVVILDATGQVQWTSGLGAPDLPPGSLAEVGTGSAHQICPRPAPGAARVWCLGPIADRQQRVIGALAASTSASGIYRTIQSVHDILFTWTLIALVVIGGLSLLVARSITGPIGALTRRARAMAAGDFNARLPVQGHDEVGQLAQMFNHLGRRLQETLGEIRAEQRRAAAILTNMTDGIVAVDAAGTVLLCNPSAAAMLDVDAQAVVGRPAVAVLPDGIAPRLRLPTGGPDAHAVAGTEDMPLGDPGEGESSPLALNAPARHLLAHFAPLGDAGTPRGKEFVANVSHELRTPVTTIKLYVESLLEWGLDDPAAARPKLEVIGSETDRMAGLIGDLLQLSQLDHRGVIRTLQRSDVTALARSVVTGQQAGAIRKGVTVELRSVGACEATVDPDRIVQVLHNLLTNAIDFTAPGGQVCVSVEDGAGGTVEIEVADTGIGIPADDLPRIFDRFYRVDVSRSREYGGSGLGLAIAKEIVEAHGGRIRAESAEGQGTRLLVSLPPPGGHLP